MNTLLERLLTVPELRTEPVGKLREEAEEGAAFAPWGPDEV